MVVKTNVTTFIICFTLITKQNPIDWYPMFEYVLYNGFEFVQEQNCVVCWGQKWREGRF